VHNALRCRIVKDFVSDFLHQEVELTELHKFRRGHRLRVDVLQIIYNVFQLGSEGRVVEVELVGVFHNEKILTGSGGNCKHYL